MERMLKLWWVVMKKLKDSWNFNYPGFSINWAGDIRRRCEWKKHKWSARMLVLYRPWWGGGGYSTSAQVTVTCGVGCPPP